MSERLDLANRKGDYNHETILKMMLEQAAIDKFLADSREELVRLETTVSVLTET